MCLIISDKQTPNGFMVLRQKPIIGYKEMYTNFDIPKPAEQLRNFIPIIMVMGKTIYEKIGKNYVYRAGFEYEALPHGKIIKKTGQLWTGETYKGIEEGAFHYYTDKKYLLKKHLPKTNAIVKCEFWGETYRELKNCNFRSLMPFPDDFYKMPPEFCSKYMKIVEIIKR